MEQLQNYKNISGWGADLDPQNRPAYPKEKTPPGGTGAHWDQPEWQTARTKIFTSVERPRRTPLVGSSVPPVGISGWIRGVAYGLSESDLRRWLLLLFADRVNVVEGLVMDLAKGHVPNIFAEMGWKAEWKYNRPKAVAKIAVAAGLVSIAAFYFANRRSKTRPISSSAWE